MKAVVDTSWIYALLNGHDPHHAKAKRDAARHERLMVPPAIIVEALRLIEHRMGTAQARAAVDALRRVPNIHLGDPEHDHDTTMRVWDAHPQLGYADAAAVAAARGLAIGICTYDTKQRKAHASGRP